ncbi:hypothetical protein AVEN_147049-1 [Araneus ventricosus]|uniref:Uncharacterized protein n=1 Tax=Araneus ventricosus TaxID=182803 RepID=A0A4Y2R7R6_ARAVE|nr:hypothetical protein AVEN_147049-1 [Araneus ventricosus]
MGFESNSLGRDHRLTPIKGVTSCPFFSAILRSMDQQHGTETARALTRPKSPARSRQSRTTFLNFHLNGHSAGLEVNNTGSKTPPPPHIPVWPS